MTGSLKQELVDLNMLKPVAHDVRIWLKTVGCDKLLGKLCQFLSFEVGWS